jgi:hypothetical protein
MTRLLLSCFVRSLCVHALHLIPKKSPFPAPFRFRLRDPFKQQDEEEEGEEEGIKGVLYGRMFFCIPVSHVLDVPNVPVWCISEPCCLFRILIMLLE